MGALAASIIWLGKLAGTILVSLIARDTLNALPLVEQSLIKLAAKLMPAHQRTEVLSQWISDLADIEGPEVLRVRFAVGCFWTALGERRIAEQRERRAKDQTAFFEVFMTRFAYHLTEKRWEKQPEVMARITMADPGDHATADEKIRALRDAMHWTMTDASVEAMIDAYTTTRFRTLYYLRKRVIFSLLQLVSRRLVVRALQGPLDRIWQKALENARLKTKAAG